MDFVTDITPLINHPVVETPLGARLCRPSEAALNLLPVPRRADFTKNDGEVVLDHGSRRV